MADKGGAGPAGSGGVSGSGDHSGGVGSASSANAPGEEAGGLGDPTSDEQGLSFSGTNDRGFFGGIMDAITDNPVASGLQGLGMLTGVPALGMMGLAAHAGKALGAQFGGTNTGPVGPGDGDGPESAQIQQIVPPAFNPIEDMVGSEYVAYGGVGADQLRKQLFPYMNFNQPTQPGVTGLMGQYAGVGQGTGLMTGPFGMSNTQV